MSALPQAAAPWRSLLFIPATSERFVASAAKRGADAIILDLEDSIALDAKAAARAALAVHVPRLAGEGVTVFVRVNGGDLAAGDIAAAAMPGVTAILIPKIESAAALRDAQRALNAAESANGLARCAIGVIALLEGPNAVLDARAIAAVGGGLIGLGFGSEDFAAAMGVRPTLDSLLVPAQMVAMAARGAGLQSFGLPGSIAGFQDLEELAALAAKARAIGFTGAVCIHPAQVPILNAAFSPSAEERAWAEAVVEAFDAALARGEAAVAVQGRMVDPPVYDQAKRLLALSERMGTQRAAV
ncbi:MAG: HpcH/HpaI aldolase/citrate lyase family protein [Elsteraceae bacterium]